MLALSATPIPRTLHMSLAGLRDISVIETPPEGRRAIRTSVGEYDDELVKAALEREHARGGQSFYLHNRVETIEEARSSCSSLPRPSLRGRARTDAGARARGQDALVPARRRRRPRLDHDHRVRPRHPAGEHADHRARRPARARPALPDPRTRGPLGCPRPRPPLLSGLARADPRGARSSRDDRGPHRARRRLRDRDARLEIRGAGELLGSEQSGHVAAVGFELYVELLAEAVAELSGQRRTAGSSGPRGREGRRLRPGRPTSRPRR